MATTSKVERENEEICNKVRARATIITGLGEGMVELGQQIANLMAAPPRLYRATAPLVHQVAPGKGDTGGDAMVVAPPAAQIPIMVGVALDRPPQPTACPPGMGHQKLK